MARKKSSFRSRGSSSSSATANPRKQAKDCCRNFVAFMCTQVGVGAVIVVYAVMGAFTFIHIETETEPDLKVAYVENLRKNYSQELWQHIEMLNLFDRATWQQEADQVLKRFQDEICILIKQGYDGRTLVQMWSFPAALMYCLSVFTMIGYGNMVPRTQWGKGVTMIYATFGIPLYILYFLNIGKVFAQFFKFLYTTLHECTHETNAPIDSIEDGTDVPPVLSSTVGKKIIVPSTACLWVMLFYILAGTILFAVWEKWTFLDSIYYCVTSLCKIGFGDFIPGAHNGILYEQLPIELNNNSLENGKDKQFLERLLETDKQTKLAINFIYMLIGMGLVAMCYNLMREEVRMKINEIKEDLKLCLEDLHGRFGNCCFRDFDEDDEQYY